MNDQNLPSDEAVRVARDAFGNEAELFGLNASLKAAIHAYLTATDEGRALVAAKQDAERWKQRFITFEHTVHHMLDDSEERDEEWIVSADGVREVIALMANEETCLAHMTKAEQDAAIARQEGDK